MCRYSIARPVKSSEKKSKERERERKKSNEYKSNKSINIYTLMTRRTRKKEK